MLKVMKPKQQTSSVFVLREVNFNKSNGNILFYSLLFELNSILQCYLTLFIFFYVIRFSILKLIFPILFKDFKLFASLLFFDNRNCGVYSKYITINIRTIVMGNVVNIIDTTLQFPMRK